MAEDSEPYPWTRRDNESHQAYEAFRVYMTHRSTQATSDHMNKANSMIRRWSARHDWVARVRAYDTYLTEAETDGRTDWLTNARSETQALADKLRGLLSERLDDCLLKKQDPTVRWSQAANVLIKLQEAGIAPVSDDKMAAEMDRVSKMIERIEGAVT